jgi:aminomethyltransferase
MVEFAGWEMPVRYAGIGEEHLAVRRAAGVFDVSHMGQIETSGPQAQAFLQQLLTNDVEGLTVGGAQYSCLCREDGGMLDDLLTYRLAEDRFLTVTNAASHGRDLAWFAEHAEAFEAEVGDVSERYAMLAVQGPLAREALARITSEALPARMRTSWLEFGGARALVCGTGYTGEDGLEVLLAPRDAPALWEALIGAGVAPCGLGARDTLRLEVCFPLYGNELGVERTPIEAGLGWCCKEATGFIGAEAVARARAAGTSERLAPFVITGPGIPRPGNRVMLGEEPVGEVTSGTYSPSLEVGAGMAYLRADLAEAGTEIEIDVRGRRRAARVSSKPLYESPG